MKKFTDTGLWSMLLDTGSTTSGSTETNTAMNDFVAELTGYCRGESDLAERTRTLRFTRTELAAMAERPAPYGAGKNALLNTVIEKALSLIN